MFWTFVAPLLCIFLFGSLTQPRPFLQPPIAIIGSGPAVKSLVDTLRAQGVPATPAVAPVEGAWNATAKQGGPQADVVLSSGGAASFEERDARMALSDAVETLRAADQSGGQLPDVILDPLVPAHPIVPPASGFQRAVPAYLVMFLTLNLLASGAHLVEDRASGRLQRLQVASGDGWSLLLGKLFIRWLVAIVQGAAMFGIGIAAFHVRVQSPVALAGFLSLYVAALGTLGIWLGARLHDPEKAQAFAIWGTMAASALGGVWWNVDRAHGLLGTIALAMPTQWGVVGLEALSNGGIGPGPVAVACLLLVALALTAALAAIRPLQR